MFVAFRVHEANWQAAGQAWQSRQSGSQGPQSQPVDISDDHVAVAASVSVTGMLGCTAADPWSLGVSWRRGLEYVLARCNAEIHDVAISWAHPSAWEVGKAGHM